MCAPIRPALAASRLTHALVAGALLATTVAGCRDAAGPEPVAPAPPPARPAVSADLAAPTAALAAAPGTLVICNVAGVGVPVGGGFDFVHYDAATGANRSSVSVRAGAAPAGTCSAPISRPEGSVAVYQVGGSNVAVSRSVASPAAYLQDTVGGRARVAIFAGQTTTLTLTTTTTLGSLVICGVAGQGVPPLTLRTVRYYEGTTPTAAVAVNVPGGAAPAGSCAAPIVRQAGTVLTVNQDDHPDYLLHNVAVSPITSRVQSVAHAKVRIVGGQTTRVTFTNISIYGMLEICNVGGPGVSPTALFGFTAYDAYDATTGYRSASVPAGPAPTGTCGAPIRYRLPYTWTPQTVTAQAPPPGVRLASVAVGPTGHLKTLVAGGAVVSILAGRTTRVTFTHVATHGALVVCTVAGPGVTLGTNFWYFVAQGTTYTTARAPAGAAPAGTCSAPEARWPGVAQVTLMDNVNGRFGSVAVLPAGRFAGAVAGYGANVQIVAGVTTRMTFTVAR